MSKNLKSNIAIDLGGKYTGVISYTSAIKPSSEDINAMIITMPDQGSGINYTVKDRTACRHHIRSEDRFKKARKLIYQAISAAISRDLTKDEKESISSLMKRRGYTRLETEIDMDSLRDCSTEFFASVFPSIFDNESQLSEQFERKLSTPEIAKDFLMEYEKSEALDKLKLVSDNTERSLYKSALSNIKKSCELMISQIEFGHKHRKQYLSAIFNDLKKDSRLEKIRCSLGKEALYKCVGNISNLQLRALRWYFNDITLKKAINSFNKEKFRNVWIRAYQFFQYPDRESREKIKAFIDDVKTSNDVIKCLCQVDPILTIPPYENQNNRRPPIDKTLLLSTESLDKQYKNWENWTEKLASLIPEVTSGLDEILITTDRKSLQVNKKSSSYTKDKFRHSYILQRILDLSKSEKLITNIRIWSKDSQSKIGVLVQDLLSSILGEECLTFKKFADQYYRECDYAKRGLWFTVENKLLEISNLHPPMKNKMMSEIVAAILSVHDNFDFEFFKREIWSAKIKRNSTVRSICKSIEDIRKSYGNSFNEEYKLAICKSNKSKLTPEEETLVAIKDKVEAVSSFIYSKLFKDDLEAPKFNNPYSLSQLYTVIETDSHGFSSNCLAVVQENSWRMQSCNGLGAICSRLIADSVRPFDGSLSKILDRQAYEIAKSKVKEIISLPQIKDTKIDIGILIESNQFDFSASIAQIKDSLKKKKIKQAADKGKAYQLKRWQSKDERIKSASLGICAYTGRALTDDTKAEIDHIIPRSYTKDLMGTIFNSEANLIYVSQKGNQDKLNRQYNLSDLSPNYLEKQFKTTDVAKIRSIITSTVKEIAQKNSRFIFDLMTNEERSAVRHALFMPNSESYFTVINAISNQYSTRVNGTQAYFVKLIIKKIKSMLEPWLLKNNNSISFEAWKVDCEATHTTRVNLSKQLPFVEKKTPQSITSHAIDALCVLATACDDNRIAHVLANDCMLDNLSSPNELKNLIPIQFNIKDISRKSFIDKDTPASRKLYKDTIYAEHFIPVMVMNDIVKIGFDWGKNCIAITKGASEFINLVAHYFSEEYKQSDKFHTYRIDKHKAYSLFHKANCLTTQEEKDTLSCLSTLYYTTANKDVMSVYDQSKKVFKSKTDILSKKRFEIKVEASISKKIKLDSKVTTLMLPALDAWKKVADKLEDVLDKKVDRSIAIDLIRSRFLNRKLSPLEHKIVKQVFSLPIIDAPSGGIRIKRKNSEQKVIYQLLAANTPETVLSKGFPVNASGEILWKKSIDVDCYVDDNLTRTKSNSCDYDIYVNMDEKRVVYQSEDIVVQISPGTIDRRYIFVEQDFQSFNICMGNKFKSPLDLNSEYKFDRAQLNEFLLKLKEYIDDDVEIGVPRSGIKISSIGKTINYFYSVETSNAKMNKAFASAK